MNTKVIEVVVGLFIIAGAIALLFLAYRVSSFSNFSGSNFYTVTAEFDNVGDLKVRAPVSIAGVNIGSVKDIVLDPQTFRAKVVLAISRGDMNLPADTSASILTQGLLGSNYISLIPGFSPENLTPGGQIETTRSAIILENLIGQLMYSLTGDKDKSNGDKKSAADKTDQTNN